MTSPPGSMRRTTCAVTSMSTCKDDGRLLPPPRPFFVSACCASQSFCCARWAARFESSSITSLTAAAPFALSTSHGEFELLEPLPRERNAEAFGSYGARPARTSSLDAPRAAASRVRPDPLQPPRRAVAAAANGSEELLANGSCEAAAAGDGAGALAGAAAGACAGAGAGASLSSAMSWASSASSAKSAAVSLRIVVAARCWSFSFRWKRCTK